MTIEEAITCLEQSLALNSDLSVLSDLQESVFRLCWEGKSYSKIAETLDYEPDYIKKIGVQLWQLLSKTLEKKVTKKNLHAVFRQYHAAHQNEGSATSNVSQAFQDWGDAIHVHDFWGRNTELNTLKSWIVGDDCHLVCILGQGGIGKTAIAVKISEKLRDEFHCIIWRSLKQSPFCRNFLADVLTAFPESQASLPHNLDAQIACLIQYLQANRCLLILDNLESILQNGQEGGQYREQYQDYHQLLEQLSDGRHQSCVILTSREKPMGLAMREGELLTVRSLHLQGLSPSAGQNILNAKGLETDSLDAEQIVQNYAGNPLALKVVASTIQSIFGGDTSLFLAQSVIAFGNIWDLLKQQLNRLSPLEQQVMYWLAINREWVTLLDLQEDLFPKVPQRDLIAALTSLQNRSLIETQVTGFTQQSVVMEYMTEQLISVLEDELLEQNLALLTRHAIFKAQAKDYIRDIQARLIIQPLLARLLSHFSHPKHLQTYLKTSLNQLRNQPLKEVGYAGGNLLNLLCQSDASLSHEDLSHLTLWQSYLPHSNLSHVNLAHSNLDKSVFAEAFGGITAVAFSPNGQLLATGDTAGGINLWQVQTGKKLTIYEGHRFWVWSLQFSPDGTMLLSTGDDYLVKLWDVNTEQCLNVFKGHELSVTSGCFNPSGDLVATCSQDESIRIWAIGKQDESCIQILNGHVNRVWSISFSPTEQLLASAAEDNTIKLWNPLTGECLQTLKGHENWVKSVAFNPNGTLLASGGFDHMIKIWDIQSGQCLTTLQGHTNTVTSVVFRPDGLHLASSSYDQTLKIWDLATEECLTTCRGHSNRIWVLAYAPDGKGLVSGGDDHAVKFWVEKTGRCSQTIQGHTNISLSVDVNPNLQYFASGHEDQNVRLWDYETGQLRTTLYGHTNRVWSVAFAPMNMESPSLNATKILASGSADSTVRLWDYETSECRHTLLGHKSWVWSVAFSPDAQSLASSSYDQTIKRWDVETGACLQTFQGHKGPVSSVVFSPSGKELVSSSFDYTIKVWSIESGDCLQTLEGHTNNVWSIAFSPDGQTLASSSYDQTIKLWAWGTGECMQTIQGHEGPVVPIHFTPDGMCLITGSYDRSIKLWDLKTGQCQTTLKGHSDVVVSLSFTAESLPLLMSASFDETIKRWDLTTGTCLSTIRVPRPYEKMNILGLSGLTTAQISTLKALGAIEKDLMGLTT